MTDQVNGNDLQEFVDFIRGYAHAEYRYLDIEKGYWKLYDSPHAVPLVVQNKTTCTRWTLSYERPRRPRSRGVPTWSTSRQTTGCSTRFI